MSEHRKDPATRHLLAMAVMLVYLPRRIELYFNRPLNMESLAKDSVALADALLAELEKKP